MRIAVDAMGGDYAPGEVIAGAARAAAKLDGEIILVGRKEVIQQELSSQQLASPRLLVHHASEVVEMGDSPRVALRQKAGSSVTVCVDLVREGKADAAVSAGNSGAFMAAATMRLRTLPGVQRPAIAIFVPTAMGKRICLDAGANVDCKPEHLAEFALMGSVYAEHALGISSPRVGLLSIGTERSKGNELTLAAYELLKSSPVNFIGNVEGNQVFGHEVDVTVCDGFVGNVLLKTTEGACQMIFADLKKALTGSLLAKLGATLMKPALRGLRSKYDYADYGGALLLGVNGICVVAHGKSDARAIAQAIMVGAQGVVSGVKERMAESFGRLCAAPQAASGP